MSDQKCCSVAYALPARQYLWNVVVPKQATVAQLLQAARVLAAQQGETEQVPWDSSALVFFFLFCEREDVPREGDRVEIYRPLLNDPRASRRARTRR